VQIRQIRVIRVLIWAAPFRLVCGL